jgi:PleD family two-component response regulator
MLIQKQGAEEHKVATKEEEHRKQYHVKTRILIVDDEPDFTLAFKKSLRDKGFEQVETVNEPLLALKNFKAGSYDLLVIDIVMPEMDGFSRNNIEFHLRLETKESFDLT